jgi:hypothetical protein
MIKFLNDNLPKYIEDFKAKKKHEDIRFYVRDILTKTHKTIWKSMDKNIVLLVPKYTMFGRFLIDVSDPSDIKMVCNDIFPVLDGTAEFHEKKINQKDLEKVMHLYDGNLVRLYYINEEWRFATCNTMDAKNTFYRTNKNKDIKKISTTFYEMFIHFFTPNGPDEPKFDLKKFARNKTHMFLFKSDMIFNMYEIKETEMIYMGSLNNDKEGCFIPNKIMDKSTLVKTGTIYYDNKNNIHMAARTIDYVNRSRILRNVPNVDYIVLRNLHNEQCFKGSFPSWSNRFDHIKNKRLKKISKNIYKWYKRTHSVNYKLNSRDLSNTMFILISNKVHEFYLLTKKQVTENIVYEILICMDPCVLSTLLRIWI